MERPQPILVFGQGGQVGRALMKRLGDMGVCPSVEEADFTKPHTLPDVIRKYDPLAIINAAAYTAVDKAESEEALSFAINAEAPRVLAEFAAEEALPLIHYSTDYVYPGDGELPWREDSPTGPLNAYGRTKLAGDEAIRKVGAEHLIFRTSWVYDEDGKNFVNTMLRLGAERESLKVVNDQIGAPTYAMDIARYTLLALLEAIEREEFPSGIYHLCNSGHTSWQGFAESIFDHASEAGLPLKVSEVQGIPTTDYPTPAKRPLNSRLSLEKIEAEFGFDIESWEDALARCLQNKFAASGQIR
jgi:dTDP-4-dehydrorhamnose reductase